MADRPGSEDSLPAEALVKEGGQKTEGASDQPAANARQKNPWEQTVLFAGTIFFIMLFLFGQEASRPFVWPLTFLSIVGLAMCVISWMGRWPFKSPLFPEPNFSSRNLQRNRRNSSTSALSKEHILSLVKGPAIGLIVTGALNCAIAAFVYIVIGIRILTAAKTTGVSIFFIVPFLLVVAPSSFILYAGFKLMKLERRGAGIAASILAMVAVPGNIIGLPIGIWALVVLSRKEVIKAFIANSAKQRPEVGGQGSEMPPHFSRMAKWGGIWAGVAFLAVVGAFLVEQTGIRFSFAGPLGWKIIYIIFVSPLTFVSVTAPVGTTVLGWTAVSQIRRSKGKLLSLRLAVFDGLLFPLLAVDALFIWVWESAARLFVDFNANPAMQNRPDIDSAFTTKLANLLADHPEILIITVIFILLIVDFMIIRYVWRALNKPLDAASEPAPDTGSTSTSRWALGFLIAVLFGTPLLLAFLAGNVEHVENVQSAYRSPRDAMTAFAQVLAAGDMDTLKQF